MSYNVELFLAGVIYQLALMRVTRLINADTILDRPRLAIASAAKAARIAGDDAGETRWSTALYFVQCPWCVSMWLAIFTTWILVWILHLPWWATIPIALAASHVVGICARFADTEEIDYEDDVTS